MKTKFVFSMVMLSVLVAPMKADAIPQTQKEVKKSARVLSEMLADSDTRIPPWLLKRSRAIAIITNLKQGGFGLGGRRGDGVILSKFSDGTWSHPSFINMSGGSIGFQAGFKSSDLILVFPSQAAVDDVIDGSFELGGSVSGTAGPLGRSVSDSFEGFDDNKIYVYSRSKGLFGSVALEGSDMSIDHKDNARFYGRPITVKEIFSQPSLAAPPVVNSLKQVLQQASRY